MLLYHATTHKKMERYMTTGAILKPVRGFNTSAAAYEWGRLVGRDIVLEFEATKPYKMPDHHNRYGEAWWNDADVFIYMRLEG